MLPRNTTMLAPTLASWCPRVASSVFDLQARAAVGSGNSHLQPSVKLSIHMVQLTSGYM